MVPIAGFEPALNKEPDSKSDVSADFTIWAKTLSKDVTSIEKEIKRSCVAKIIKNNAWYITLRAVISKLYLRKRAGLTSPP